MASGNGVTAWKFRICFEYRQRISGCTFPVGHILNDISHIYEDDFRASVDIQVFLMLLKYIFH